MKKITDEKSAINIYIVKHYRAATETGLLNKLRKSEPLEEINEVRNLRNSSLRGISALRLGNTLSWMTISNDIKASPYAPCRCGDVTRSITSKAVAVKKGGFGPEDSTALAPPAAGAVACSEGRGVLRLTS